MTGQLQLFIVLALVLVLTFGFIMDGYAVFLRVAGVEELAEMLAMANLVQYIARISNVVVIFVLSFAFETGRLTVDVSFVFILASFFGMLSVFALIRSRKFCNLITICSRPLLFFSFRSISRNFVWRELGVFRKKSIKLAGMSGLTNTLIVMAMFVPFGIASYYPEMRMTAVYFGQLINFFATLLVFAIQDPVSMRLIDGGVLEEAGAALLYGRIFSYFLATILFLFLMFR